MLELKSYDVLEQIGNELDVCESMVTDYLDNETSYLCELFQELSDNYVPIYYNDLWENAKLISDYIEDSISEFGVPDNDLMKLFSWGYYKYYNHVLYSNFEEIKFNIVANAVNEYLDTIDTDTLESIDLDDLNDDIETRIEDIDNNDKMLNVLELANSLINEIKEGSFSVVE